MIRIHKQIDSETLHLPELRPLIGKMVEITVREAQSAPTITPGTGNWGAADLAARSRWESGYEVDAWRQQREFGLKHGEDHLP